MRQQRRGSGREHDRRRRHDPAATLAAHAALTDFRGYDAAVLAEPSLVGYWRLDETAGTVAIDAKAGRNGSYKGTVRLAGATWRR